MRLEMRCLVGVVVTAVLFAGLTAVGSSTETSPTVEAVNSGIYSHYWSPMQVSVGVGGTVAIRNMTKLPRRPISCWRKNV